MSQLYATQRVNRHAIMPKKRWWRSEVWHLYIGSRPSNFFGACQPYSFSFLFCFFGLLYFSPLVIYIVSNAKCIGWPFSLFFCALVETCRRDICVCWTAASHSVSVIDNSSVPLRNERTTDDEQASTSCALESRSDLPYIAKPIEWRQSPYRRDAVFFSVYCFLHRRIEGLKGSLSLSPFIYIYK